MVVLRYADEPDSSDAPSGASLISSRFLFSCEDFEGRFATVGYLSLTHWPSPAGVAEEWRLWNWRSIRSSRRQKFHPQLNAEPNPPLLAMANALNSNSQPPRYAASESTSRGTAFGMVGLRAKPALRSTSEPASLASLRHSNFVIRPSIRAPSGRPLCNEYRPQNTEIFFLTTDVVEC
jgi:hypothetical protein